MSENVMPAPATYLDIAHDEALRENARRECVAIDRALRASKFRKQRAIVRNTKTLHDIAQDNEFVRMLLRASQKDGRI